MLRNLNIFLMKYHIEGNLCCDETINSDGEEDLDPTGGEPVTPSTTSILNMLSATVAHPRAAEGHIYF